MSTLWDLFFDLWADFASIGWSGYSTEGRGAVTVEMDEDAISIAYQAGTPCECHAKEVEGYDPRSAVVVVLRRADGAPFYGEPDGHLVRVLEGWPRPTEAVARLAPPSWPRLPAH